MATKDWTKKTVFEVMRTMEYGHELSKAIKLMARIHQKQPNAAYQNIIDKKQNNVLSFIDLYMQISKGTAKNTTAAERSLIVITCENVLKNVVRQQIEKQPKMKMEYERRIKECAN